MPKTDIARHGAFWIQRERPPDDPIFSPRITRSTRNSAALKKARLKSKAPKMHKQDSLSRAKHQVDAMKGFYIHLAVFVPAIAVLFIINAVAKKSGWWVQWPFLGWGAGILGHAFAVFSHSPGLFKRWEQRKVEALKAQLDASEKPVGEVPGPMVAETPEIAPTNRIAR